MPLKLIRVVNKNNDTIIGDKIELADTFFARLKGLLGRTGLEEGEGIILTPCSAIHCLGMKFPIDVVFMDKDKKVIWIRENMEPGSIEIKKSCVYVLEVGAGVIARKRVQIGHQLEFQKSLKD